MDRVVLRAYLQIGQAPAGFRTFWRRWKGSDDGLDNTHLMRVAGRFSRRSAPPGELQMSLAGRNPDYADTSFSEIERDLGAAWVQAHLHDEDPVAWEDVSAEATKGYELARKSG